MEEEAWYKSEGYKANHEKFIYTFIEDEDEKKTEKLVPKSNTKRKDPSDSGSKKAGGLLSITEMTDEAISHRSRAVSSCKSDRSYYDDKSDN